MTTALSIIVSGSDPARAHSALSLAAARAATGGTVRILFDTHAVGLIDLGPETDVGALLETCLDLAVEVIVCQSGLGAACMSADSLDPRMDVGGMIGFVASADPSHIVLA